MKRKWVLTKQELSEAVAAYVSAKAGVDSEVKCQVWFRVEKQYDGMDRPTGLYEISAEVEEK
jgi:hypothetical protein